MVNDSDEEHNVENLNLPNIKVDFAETAKKGGKGKKKVKKTRMYFDEKGYMVNEDYSSYEECENPPISQMVKKEPIKRVVQHNLNPPAAKAGNVGSKNTGATNQKSLAAFFKK